MNERWKAFIGGYFPESPFYSIGEFGSKEAAQDAVTRRLKERYPQMNNPALRWEGNDYRYGDEPVKRWAYVERVK